MLGLRDFPKKGLDAYDGVTYRLYYSQQPSLGITEILYASVIAVDKAKTGHVEIQEKMSMKSQRYLSDGTWEDYYPVFNVTTIEKGALENCSEIESIYIPKSISIIEPGAFSGCNKLTSINVSTENPIYDSKNNCNGICRDEMLVVGCSSTVITDKIYGIGMKAFLGLTNLRTITIPQQISYIGEDAFSGCTNVSNVMFYGKERIYLERDPFDKEIWENATLHVHDYAIESFKENDITNLWKNFKNIVVFEKVTDFNLNYYVDGELYKQCKHKYDDEIVPEPTPTKKGMIFSGWSEIPERMPGKEVNVAGTFSWSKTMKDNVIYEVTDTINNFVAVIGNEGASVEVKIVSDIEFDYNYKVATIVDNAFYGCKDVTTIDMPATITSIGERAFAKIDKLTDVTILAEEVPETDRTAFENSYINYVTLYVPYGSINKYKAVGPWKDFKEIVAVEGTKPISVETCTMPTISFVDGKLKFESETDGSECHYEIKVEDAKEGIGSEVILSSAYEITVFASKDGFNDSEKNTATLYWVNVDPISTGVIDNEMRVNTNAILVQNAGSVITISGIADGNDVAVYNISGQLIGQGKATGNRAEISTGLTSGDICIIKIGDKSVKYILR